MLIFAHRGASGAKPENTLAAFAQGLADGADGVEFDVHGTADGVPVVIHDRDVSRTTNGSGAVETLTLARIKALDAGNGERVPTLAETLDVLAGRARLYIEVKQAGIEGAVLELLRRYEQVDWLIGSFDMDILRAVRARDATAELWPITVEPAADVFAAAAELGASTISLSATRASPAVMARCRAAGLDLAVWTVNDAVEARRVRDLGVSGLCTDEPAAIVRALRADLGEAPA